MPAHINQLSTVISIFSAFLRTKNVSDEVSSHAKLLLTEFFADSRNVGGWNPGTFDRFLKTQGNLTAYGQPVLEYVRSWLEKFPPHQTNVALQHYLLALKADSCSASTIKNYRSDISQFLQFMSQPGLEAAFQKPKVIDFLLYQKQKDLKISSVRRKLVSLNQFVLWMESTDYLSGVSVWMNPLIKDLENSSWGESSVGTQKQITPPTPNPDYKYWTLPLDKFDPKELEFTTIMPPQAGSNLKNQEMKAQLRHNLRFIKNRLKPQLIPGQPLFQKWLPYLNLLLMLLFLAGGATLAYRQLGQDANNPLAYPTSLTRPNRTLSFQGRLTDTAKNPITAATNMRFRLYDSGPSVSGGNILWDSGTCSISPDQDGIFSTGLGDECGSEITDDVFSENSNVWLQVEVNNDVTWEVLDPRQSIKTVPYALNSETVQGYPASVSAVENTILVMDNNGDVVLGSSLPTLRSTGTSFTIEAQTLTLQTASGSNGDIILNPDGIGRTGVLSDLYTTGYISAPGATLSATYTGGKPLVVNGLAGHTANLTEWSDGDGNTTVVDENGNLGIGTSDPGQKLEVNGNLKLSNATSVIYAGTGGLNISQAGASVDLSGIRYLSSINRINNGAGQTLWVEGYNVDIGVGNESGKGRLAVGWNGGGDFTNIFNVNGTSYFSDNVGIGSTNPGYKLDVNGTGRFTGAVDLDGDLELNSTITDINGSVGTAGQVLSSTTTGVDWIDVSGSYTGWNLAGDTGTPEAIASGQNANIVGGINGIDTIVSATDTLTLNLDTTEIGTSTFGSGSGLTWTFDASGGTDTTLAFADGSITPTLSATGLFNITTGNFKIGNGTPGLSLGGEDAYIEGTLEVDGATQMDGALTTAGTLTANGTLDANGLFALGDNGETGAIDTLNWDIATSGEITAATNETINGIDINAGAISDVTTLALSGQLTSTLATGTAPFSIASTTLVANLNVDMFDGLDSLQFLRSDTSDDFTSGTLGINSGATLDVKSGAILDVNGNLAISDTDIALDGATANLNSTGNFSINTDDIFAEKSSGNVGIGLTTPLAKLDIEGSASTSGTLAFRGTTDPKIDILNGENFGIRTSVGGDTGLTERLTILNNGNVGIDSTNPTNKLEVAGNIRISNDNDYLQLGSFSANNRVFGEGNNAYLRGNSRVRLQNSSVTQLEVTSPNVSIPNYNLILTSGKIGVGNSSPGTLLQLGNSGTLGGTLSIAGSTSGLVTLQTAAAAGTYSLTLPTSDGNPDQLLTTNGSGVLSWVDAGAIVDTDDQTLAEVLSFGNSAGAYSIDMNNQLITNIGNAGTDFTAGGGLTLASTLTASNGLTLTTGALNLTGTSGALSLSGLSASSINTGANALTVTSSNFNTTATGINSTAIGATTPSTGAFTTLSSTGATTLGNNSANVAINSNIWDITGAGVASGLTGLSSSGTVTLSGLTPDRLVSTTTGGQLTTSLSSANVALSISDETGSGLMVFNNAPTFSTGSVNFSGIASDIITPTNEHLALMPAGAGNVGVGTTTPTSFKLEIAGNVGPSAHDTYDLGSNGKRWKDIYLGSETLHIGSSITDEGTMGYNTTSKIFSFGTDSTTNADIAFFTDDLFLDKSTGFVGINDSTPSYNLDVNGTGRFTGAVDLDGDLELNSTLTDVNGSVGTNGQVLSSTATGVDWVDPATPTIADNSLDFIKFEPTMDLDSNLILNQGAYTWTQNFTGTTTTGLSYVANSLTSGTALSASSNSLSTGSLVNLSSTSTAANSNTQKLLNLSTSGANANASQTTYGVYSTNSHSGTGSTNIAGYFESNTGATNWGIRSSATGSTFATAGHFLASDTTQNQGILVDATKTTNTTAGSTYGAIIGANATSALTTGSETVTGIYTTVGRSNHTGGTVDIRGLQVDFGTIGNGGTTNLYGLYIANATGGDTNYAIYSAGGDSYFAGNLGLGDTTPTYKLDVTGTGRFTGAVDLDGDLELNGTLTDVNGSVGGAGELLSSTGTGTDWIAASTLSVGNANTLDSLDSLQFLRSDTSDNFTSGTLGINSGATLDVNSGATLDVNGNLSIADTDIALDGASANLNSTGNFSINTDDIYVEKSTGEVGIGTTSPSTTLHVLAPAGSGVAEEIARFGVSDSPSSYITINNRSTSDYITLPTITGYSMTNYQGFSISGKINMDQVGGGSPALYFDASTQADAAIVNRPLFAWRNDEVAQMTMAASGNLGIGTTDPTNKLDVAGTGRFTGTLTLSGALDANGDVSIADTNIALDGASTNLLVTGDLSINSDDLYVDKSTGSVGIGTTSPDGGFQFYGNNAYFGDSARLNSTALHLSAGAGLHEPILRWDTNGTTRWEMYTYGTTHGNAGTLALTNDTTRATDPELAITATGDIGFGTLSPSSKFDFHTGDTDGVIIDSNTSNGDTWLELRESSGADHGTRFFMDGDDNKMYIQNKLSGSYTTALTIPYAGSDARLGVNYTAPTATLHAHNTTANVPVIRAAYSNTARTASLFQATHDGNTTSPINYDYYEWYSGWGPSDGGIRGAQVSGWGTQIYEEGTLSLRGGGYNSTGAHLYITSGGAVNVNLPNAASTTICRSGSQLTTCSSLGKYKDNQQNLSFGLETLMRLRPVEYDWNINDKQHDIGFIAEEVAAVNPLLGEYELGGQKLSGVKYGHMTALIVKGIQEQQGQIQANSAALSNLGALVLADNGEVLLSGGAGVYQVSVRGSLTDNLYAAAKVISAKIEAGLITTKELVVDSAQIGDLSLNSLNIAGQPIRDYIASIVSEIQNDTDESLVDPSSTELAESTPEPVFTDNNLAELLVEGDATVSGTLTASTSLLGELTADSATISGDLTVDTVYVATISAHSSRLALLEAKTAEFESIKAQTADLMTATVSGTLYANNIYDFETKIANSFEQPGLIDIIKQKLDTNLDTGITNVYDALAQSSYPATSSADLNLKIADLNLATEDVTLTAQALFIEKYFKVNGAAYVADSLGVGNTIFVGQGTIIADGSIGYTAPIGQSQVFSIQPSRQGSISLLAGLMTLTDNGQVEINGNLKVAGSLEVEDTLLSNLIQPADFGNPFQVQVAGINDTDQSVNESRFEIVNELGAPVATISAQGRAAFADGIAIGSEALDSSNPDENIVASKSSGKATISAGSSEIIIQTTRITNDTLVYITPVGSTNNQVIYVKSQRIHDPEKPQEPGQFVVGFDQPTTQAVQFNWWLVN